MNNFFYSLKKVHFVGVGGVSMSKLCAYTLSLGIRCSGSDAKNSDTIVKLKALGADIVIGESRDFAREADLVVYSSAIKSSHPELLSAKKCMERKDYLAMVAKNFDNVIAISGAHGKTTTTAMIAWIFNIAEKSFTSHIGGDMVGGAISFGGGSEYFITEACEYSKSFLKLYPDVGIVLNVDYDHPDCYKSLQDTYLAFATFMSQCKNIVLNGDFDFLIEDNREKIHSNVVTYGTENSNYFAKNITRHSNFLTFDLYKKGEFVEQFTMWTTNTVIVECALATIAVCEMFGIERSKIQLGLATFPGLKNRFQCLGIMSNGAKMIVDYAHHPKQMQASISSAYYNLPDDGDLIVLFEPHTYSRTKALCNDFCKVLKGDWTTVLMPTYSAREKPEEGMDASQLYIECCKNNDRMVYVNGYNMAKYWLAVNTKSTDTILCLGAGLVSEKLVY